MFPEVTWLVPWQEFQFLSTAPKCFLFSKLWGGSQKQEIKLKNSGDFFLLWIVETKKVVDLCKT